MMRSWRVAGFVAAVLFSGSAAAQTPEAVVVFDGEALGADRYRVPGRGGPWFEGLKASPVDGSVWVATHRALLRFRGTSRDEFRTEDLEAELGAYCGSFRPLAFDPDGTLWLSLWCSGPDEWANLATFDGTRWRLLRPADQRAPDYALRPHLMAFGPGGVVWLATYFGLVRREGETWTLFNPENSPLPHQQVSALHVEPSGAVWVGTYGGHLARFDGTTWQVVRYSGAGANGLLTAGMPHSLATDPGGLLYFTYHHNGRVRRGSPEGFEAAPCPREGQVPGYSEGVAFDREGVLWIAHDSDHAPGVAGLYRWDGRACRPIVLPQNGSILLAIDTAGNKWVAMGWGQLIAYREGGALLGG